MIYKNNVLLIVICAIITLVCSDDVASPPVYRYCVPQHVINECHKFTSDQSAIAVIECIPGRDRMECIDKVNHREADFVVVEPEDMYVAFHKANEDFKLFSEIRTVEEPSAEFRYEGIILVHKNSDIHKLEDLKGKKSCHTGFGRNVGYRIPITKLKKNGIFKVAKDPSMTPVEKELKGFSELFSKSCIVGEYSPNAEFNQALKKRYPNLCALCEDPVKCDYPDKFSGYDGAIRCLANNGGDVAFTKVIYVRKHFGLPIGNNPVTTKAENNPDDFEYLCEDGTRKPVNGPACSWAQRPWPGYMGNGDISSRVERLQNRINEFYNNGKKSEDKAGAAKLSINEKNVVVKKNELELPGQHLIKAQYKDVIERDGTMETKIRLCLSTAVELKKCDVLRQVAYSRDIRPELQCILAADCPQNVQHGLSDITVLSAADYSEGRKNQLTPILYEYFGNDEHYVVIVEKSVSDDLLSKLPIHYEEDDIQAQDAAIYFSYKRGSLKCPGGGVISAFPEENESGLRVVKASTLSSFTPEIDLICTDLSRKSITEYKTCNFDATLPRAIFMRKDVNTQDLDNMIHGLVSIATDFGHGGEYEEIFELFGEFEPNAKNVIFSDDVQKLVTTSNFVPIIDEDLYNEIHCIEKEITTFELYQPGHHY